MTKPFEKAQSLIVNSSLPSPGAKASVPLASTRRTSSPAGGRAGPRVIQADAPAPLAPKARLRWDRQASRYMLLYPGAGTCPQRHGADVVQLCTGEHTVAGIVEQLAGKYARRAGGGGSARC